MWLVCVLISLQLFSCAEGGLFGSIVPQSPSSTTFWGKDKKSALSSKVASKETGISSSEDVAAFGSSEDMFLSGTFTCPDSGEKFRIRQVPGDGGCLFHALTVALIFEKTGVHRVFDDKTREMSDKLRKLSVLLLKRKDVTLFIENGEATTSSELLRIVSEHYNMTEREYCDQMLLSNSWGGGPEIVALCNHLQRPVHVYDLRRKSSKEGKERGDVKWCAENACELYCLQVCGKFGSPQYDDETPLKILCADGRFPSSLDVDESKPGDHFFSLVQA
jgi:hypothetical protein